MGLSGSLEDVEPSQPFSEIAGEVDGPGRWARTVGPDGGPGRLTSPGHFWQLGATDSREVPHGPDAARSRAANPVS
jgi:hypothetical protein